LKPLQNIFNVETLSKAIKQETANVKELKEVLKDASAIGDLEFPDFSLAFAPGLGDPDDPDGSGKSDRNRLAAINRAGELLGIEKQILDNARAVVLAQSKADRSRVHQLNNQRISLQFAKSAAQSEHEYLDAVRAANAEEDEAVKTQMLQEALTTKQINNALLRVQLEGALADEKQRNLLAEKAITEQIEQQMFNLRDQLGLVTREEKIENFKQGLINKLGDGDARIPEAVDLQRQIIDPTTVEKIQQTVRSLKQELEDLANPANMIIKSADAIGTAFTDSFKSVINGSATTQEALSNFFKNIASFFLDMAAQIIQKMITMYILNTFVGLLPGMSGGGGKGVLGQGTLDSVSSYSGITGSTRFAKGAAFSKNKIIPYAKGGIVNKPTMFAYADGGAGRFGLMGESGAEAILPLSRGSDGKLGVQSSNSMNAAMSRYSRNGAPVSRMTDANGMLIDGGADVGSAELDVRYSVERINSVDYVTAAEFERGIAQAAKRGAEMGKRGVYSDLVNKRSVRSRVGI